MRNGLFFRRHDDGSVHILKKEGLDGPEIFEAVIDKSTWVAIVAKLSRHGDTPEIIDLIEDLHLGK